MKIRNIYLVILTAGIVLTSCFPEQEVEPVDPPDDNPMVTITPAKDYSNVKEGDTLIFETIRFRLRTPIKADLAIIRFIQHTERQRTTSWGLPLQERAQEENFSQDDFELVEHRR